MNKELLLPIIKNWRSLNQKGDLLAENDLAELLAYERQTRRRLSIMTRLHQRYYTLRIARERLELIGEATAK